MDWPSTQASLQYLLRVSAVFLLALLLDRAFSRNARFRTWLWGLAFLYPVLLFLPRPEVGIPLIDRVVPTAPPLGTRVYELEKSFSANSLEFLGDSGPAPIVAAMLAAAALGVLWWLVQVVQAWRLVRSSEQLTDPEIVGIVAEAAERKGMSSAPFVVLTDRVQSPCAVGILQPYVVVPAGMASELDHDAWRAMLAHEVGHIVKADSLRLALYALVQSAFWWNPLSWWAIRRSVVAMEQCNDAEVLREGHADAKAYARLLIAAATGLSVQTVLRFVGQGALLTRVQSILDPSQVSRSPWPLASLALFAVALPHYDFVRTPVPSLEQMRNGELGYGSGDKVWYASTNGAQRVQAVLPRPGDALRAVSPDGRKIIVSRALVPGEEDLIIANADGTGARPLVATKGRDYSPRFSPDGKLVVFGTTVTGSWEIGVVDVATGKWRLVTNDGKSNLEPSFHPNGKRIVFSSHRTVNQLLWSINLDGSDAVQMTSNSGEDTAGSYSRDGRYLLYASYHRGKYDVTVLDLATNIGLPLTRSNEIERGEPRWVDGDTAVVFTANVDGHPEVHRVDFDGTNRKVVERLGAFSCPPD